MGRSQSKTAPPTAEYLATRKQSCVPTVKFTAPSNTIGSSPLNVIAKQNFRCNALLRPLSCEKATLEVNHQEFRPEPLRVKEEDAKTPVLEPLDVSNQKEKPPPEIGLTNNPEGTSQLGRDDVINGINNLPTKQNGVLFCTPMQPRGQINIEETFWAGKRELIPDYGRMHEIDKHAILAPHRLAKRGKELVSYLISEAQTDVEKVRAILRWLAVFVEFDLERGASTQSARNVLMSGRAGVPGFNEAFAYMSSLANITCEIIQGTCKSGDYYPGLQRVESDPEAFALRHAHAWCRVQLEDRWHYVDPSWVAGSVEGGKYEKHWDEQWFLAEPQLFLGLHLPLEIGDDYVKVDIRKQLENDKKYKEIVTWEREVALEPLCSGLGIRSTNHHYGVIQTKKDEVLLKFECASPNVTFSTSLKHMDGRDYTQLNALSYTVDGGFHVFVLFPTRGRFKLQIRATYHMNQKESKLNGLKKGILKKPDPDTKDDLQVINVASYLLEALGKVRSPTLPNFTIDNRWGLSDECRRAGLQLDHNKGGILKTKEGKTKLSLILPTSGWCPIIYKFSDIKQNDKAHYIYGDKQGRLLTLYLMCPVSDYYILEVWMRSTSTAANYDLCSRFLVISYRSVKVYHSAFQSELPTQTIKTPMFPSNPQGEMWGLTEHAFEVGIKEVQPDCSTILLPHGVGTLTLHLEENINFTYSLYEADNDDEKEIQGIYIEWFSDKRIIHIRLEKSGLFRLQLLGSTPGSGTFRDIGNYLLVCKSAWQGNLFPSSKEWGINDIGASIGLSILQSSTSTILCTEADLRLDIITQASTTLLLKFTDTKTTTTSKIQHIKEIACVKLQLQEQSSDSCGMLQLFKKEICEEHQDEEYVLAATYLVVANLDVFSDTPSKIDLNHNHRNSQPDILEFIPHQLTNISEDQE